MRRTHVEAATRHAVVGGVAAGAASALGHLVSPRMGAVATAGAIGALAGAVAWVGRQTNDRAARLRRDVAAIAEEQEAVRRRQELLLRGQELGRARVEKVAGRVLREIETSRAAAAGQAEALAAALGQAEERLLSEMGASFVQTEALVNLHALLQVRSATPPTRGWAASPDLLLAYVAEILDAPPGAQVVECGSGTSTLWAAYALESRGGEGVVTALEHDEDYLAKTVASLVRHGLAHRADVRHAPIEAVTLGGEGRPWYAVERIADLRDVGVLLVDGPIGRLHTESRYPALPLLRERLLPGAAVLLDDAARPEEDALVTRWTIEHPELEVTRLAHEKGTALLRVPSG